MRTVTIDDILTFRPCYTRERLASLFGDRIAVTPSEIAAAEIPAVYRAAERAIRALYSAGLTDAADDVARLVDRRAH